MRTAERFEEKRMRLKAMAGVMDFLGVIACSILIIALVALLANLISWLGRDLTQTFSDLQQSVTEAIIFH